jgi:ribosome-associated protein
LTSRTLAKKVAEFAISKKASDVLLMDLRKLTGPADFFVVCSADSDTHARAIADAVRNGTDGMGVSLWHSEGFRALSWVLLDYVDVVVHVFKKDVRPFYNLERLWGDAKLTSVEDTPPPQRVSGETSAKRPVKTIPRRTKKVMS